MRMCLQSGCVGLIRTLVSLALWIEGTRSATLRRDPSHLSPVARVADMGGTAFHRLGRLSRGSCTTAASGISSMCIV